MLLSKNTFDKFTSRNEEMLFFTFFFLLLLHDKNNIECNSLTQSFPWTCYSSRSARRRAVEAGEGTAAT